MFLTPYAHLEWAYQLHYHLCFRTYRRRQLFASGSGNLVDIFNDLYGLHGYHGLQSKIRPADVQLLLSLRPEHTISDVLKRLKGDSSTLLCRQMEIAAPLWERGYLARTSGRVTTAAVKNYLDKQAEHHGYANSRLAACISISQFEAESAIGCTCSLRSEIPFGSGDCFPSVRFRFQVGSSPY